MGAGAGEGGSGAALRQARKARGWLAAHGSERQRLLAAALLGECAPDAVEAAYAAAQDERGAIAPAPGEPPDPLAATARALDWLHAVGRAEGAVAERATAYLASEQQPDGGWGDPGAEAERRIEQAALVAAALARTSRVRPAVLARAAAFLAERWSPERVAAGGEAALALWFPVFCRLSPPGSDEALQWCGRELEKGVRAGRFDPRRTAGLFVACAAHALPGARLRAGDALAALLAAQQAGGAWGGDAAATLDGLRAVAFLAPAVAAVSPARGSAASC